MDSREISAIVRELSEERKQSLREELWTRTTINRFLGKPVNQATLSYALDLLDGNTPTPLRQRNPSHRNGKVIIIKEDK